MTMHFKSSLQIYIFSLFVLLATRACSGADIGDDRFITIVFRFDAYAHETAFSVIALNKDGTPGQEIASKYITSYVDQERGSRVEEVIPLLPLMNDFDAVQEYKVTIIDGDGDGIFSPGFYEIWYGPANANEGTRIKRGGDFGSEEETIFMNPYILFRGSNPLNYYPLGRCEGDCDDDSDCQGNFICYQREEANEAIPGCGGGSQDRSRNDYCTYPVLKIVDENPPSSPLGMCEGDCDNDYECEGNLICFHRDRLGAEEVPGCVGGSNDFTRTDYCTVPQIKIIDLSPSSPLGVCEGDCDNDGECKGHLVCFQRDGGEAVPGCVGGLDDNSRTDYCTYPSLAIKDPYENNLLGVCEGDCDNDDECADGLVCFQRDRGEEVPGCVGGSDDNSRTDYCIVPKVEIIGPNPSTPLGVCEGDCDNDDECDGDLICFHRNGGEDVPGCVGGMYDSSRTDYCIVDPAV